MKFSDDIGPLVFSNNLAQLSMSCFVQKTFVIKSQIRRKTKQVSKVLTPNFKGVTQTFLPQVVSALYCPPFGKSLVEFRLLVYVCEAWQ